MIKCKYFGKCGGCVLQNIDYESQIDKKKMQLSKLIDYDIDKIQVFYDKEYNYRNRMDFIFSKNGLGLRKRGDWKTIIPIDHCEISNEKLNELLSEINNFFTNIDFFDINKKIGTYRYAVIRTPNNDSSISFVLNEDSSKLNQAIEKIKEFSKITSANNIIVTYIPSNVDLSISSEFFVIKGKDFLVEEFLGKEFNYSVQGFFQNNTIMANKMQEYVNNLLKSENNTATQYTKYELLDLYGGVGTFGIINSELFNKVHIVENDKNCIDAAKINIDNNKIKNAQGYVLDAAKISKIQFSDKLVIITDPPRSGMNPKTITEINKTLKPDRIIYISCNVEQLGKELKKLNYKIKSVAMFDLFPQTPHIEAIVDLELIRIS